MTRWSEVGALTDEQLAHLGVTPSYDDVFAQMRYHDAAGHELDAPAEVAAPGDGSTELRHRGAGQARALLTGTVGAMALMGATSALIGGPDGVAGVVGAFAASVGGVYATLAVERDEAAATAYEVLDRAADRDPGDVLEDRWSAA